MTRGRKSGASWQSLRDRLDSELDQVEADFDALLGVSSIRYVNPNSPDSSVSERDCGWRPLPPEQTELIA